MWNQTDITKRLKISYPIIQGPFGGGLSSIKLLATVSNAGGLGSFGAHHLTPQEIRNLATEICNATQKPFALNLWVSDHDQNALNFSKEEFDRNLTRLRPYFQELSVPEPDFPERFGNNFDEQVEAIFEARPPVFSFVFGIPSKEILAECRRREIITIGAATTLDEAHALEEAEVDLIVASGFEAGGHRPSFLRPAEDSLTGTLSLVPQIADRVRTPVIAAGGIADARGIAAALTLGAQAAQIGTAFLACEESNAGDLHRAKLFADEARYTTLTRVFSGRPARGLKNRLTEELRQFEGEIPAYPVQSWFTGRLKEAALKQGRSDLVSLWASQSAPLLRIKKADTLMRNLIDETEQLFQNRTSDDLYETAY